MRFRKVPFFFLFLLPSLLQSQLPVELTDALDKTLDSMRLVLGNKSLSASISFPNESWARAKGINSGFPSTQVTIDDAYLIGSVTKPITAACILQLVDEGKLSLDDSLYRYVDTIPNINPNITIRQLLQHKSGIFDVLYNPATNQAFAQNPGKSWDAEELLRTFNMPPNAAPGGAWDYSNPNFWLLGIIAKRIEGKPFHEIYQERFFGPMGLNSFFIPSFQLSNVPVAHAWFDLNGDGITDDAHNWYMNNKALNSAAGAAGGFFATAQDLSVFMRKYMRGDLVSSTLMAEAKNTFFASGSQGNQYGLGLMKNTLGGAVCYGHGGDLVYSASSWYFPDCDIAISVLNNDGTMQGSQPKFTSWKLLPVVASLYKAARTYCATIETDELAFLTSQSISAWPNPASDNVMSIRIPVEFDITGAELAWKNTLGQHVASDAIIVSSVAQEYQVAIPDHLGSGIYFLTLSNAKGNRLATRVVIQR